MENIVIAGDNHGSRFRALKNLDLNLDLESGMEGEEAQGDKEDSSHTPEIPNVDRSQVEANNQESVTDQGKENNLGKEKTTQRSVNRPREQQNETWAEPNMRSERPHNGQAHRRPIQIHQPSIPTELTRETRPLALV